MTWQFSQIWNQSLLDREERPVTSRDVIWASELGKAKVDIYLKMKGEPLSNPPNARSLRKFEAGNIFEWIVKLILLRAGILKEQQKWVPYQYDGLLKVSGKLDFIAGGQPDYEKAKAELDALLLPDVFLRAGKNILAYFQANYPDGLEDKVLEIKSTGAYMFDLYEASKASSRNHRLQTFHYLKAENLQRGDIVYICRDDCRMLEVPVLNPSSVEDDYHKEIEEITHYFNANEQPPLEQPIVFDEDVKKFTKNWHVAYSGYLTKLYGLKDQMEFDDNYGPIAERWNRVIGRIKAGKDMTNKNNDVLEEIKGAGFNIDQIMSQFNTQEYV